MNLPRLLLMVIVFALSFMVSGRLGRAIIRYEIDAFHRLGHPPWWGLPLNIFCMALLTFVNLELAWFLYNKFPL